MIDKEALRERITKRVRMNYNQSDPFSVFENIGFAKALQILDVMPEVHIEAEQLKPMRKPLTLEEMRLSIYKLPCYVEYPESKMLRHVLLDRDSVAYFDSDHFSGKYYHYEEEYNRTWRCWASVPTDEERKAAKWE